MTQREKLIELIDDITCSIEGFGKKVIAEDIADYLLANGVIVIYGDYKDEDGAKALKKAMSDCFYSNNAVTRYTADVIAEKLCKEEAEKALAERKANEE